VAGTEKGGDGCAGAGAVFDVAVVSKLFVVSNRSKGERTQGETGEVEKLKRVWLS
jgi:hypothetical protein